MSTQGKLDYAMVTEYIKLGRKVYLYVSEQNKKFIDPTIRDIARKFRMRQDDVLTLIEDNDDLDYSIGIKTYGGIYTYERIGDYTVEAE